MPYKIASKYQSWHPYRPRCAVAGEIGESATQKKSTLECPSWEEVSDTDGAYSITLAMWEVARRPSKGAGSGVATQEHPRHCFQPAWRSRIVLEVAATRARASTSSEARRSHKSDNFIWTEGILTTGTSHCQSIFSCHGTGLS